MKRKTKPLLQSNHVVFKTFLLIDSFIAKTLRNTQQFLKDEDPQKTLDPEAIQQLIVARTAVKRENTDNNNNNNADDLPIPKDAPDVDMADDDAEPPVHDEGKETKKTKTQKQTKPKTTKTTTKETKKYSLQLTAPEQKDDTEDAKPSKPKKRITSLADVLADPNPQPQKKTKQTQKDVVTVQDNENDNDQPQKNDSLTTKKWGKRKTNS